MSRHGHEHAGQFDVLGEERAAVGFRRAVPARQPRLADELELRGLLERHVARHRQARRRDHELAKSPVAPRAPMADEAVRDADLFGRDTPLLRRCGHEQRPSGRAGAAHLLIGVGHRGAAARQLHPHKQIRVTLDVGRRAFDPHLRPVGIELLGHERGETGENALAHLQVFGDHRYAALTVDANEGVGLEGRGEARRVRSGPQLWRRSAADRRRASGRRPLAESDGDRSRARGHRQRALQRVDRPVGGVVWRASGFSASVAASGFERLRRCVNRGTDAHVGRAAADVAAHGRIDVRITRRALGAQQCDRRHDLPGLAVAALHHIEIAPGALHGAADRIVCDGFDRTSRICRPRPQPASHRSAPPGHRHAPYRHRTGQCHSQIWCLSGRFHRAVPTAAAYRR